MKTQWCYCVTATELCARHCTPWLAVCRYLERLTGLDALQTAAVDACIDWDSGSEEEGEEELEVEVEGSAAGGDDDDGSASD